MNATASLQLAAFRSKPRRDQGRRWVLIVMVIALLAAIAAAPSIHAVVKHGEEAVMARKCLDGRQAVTFLNPTTNRTAIVCNIEGVWGVVILDAAKREITAFVKNKMARFEQVIRYMRNAGYEVVQ